MPDPVLHLIAGPNGAGKSTLYERVIGPATHLEFVNADLIAEQCWPDDPASKAYEAAALADERRAELIEARASFVTETIFSHESKLALIDSAADGGYLVTLHIVLVSEELAVARVGNRVSSGGHDVPVDKIRARYTRLWPLLATAISKVDAVTVYDNIRADAPFRVAATFEHGSLVGTSALPPWTPEPLRGLDAYE
jgi:predicted ABC-type ATPase